MLNHLINLSLRYRGVVLLSTVMLVVAGLMMAWSRISGKAPLIVPNLVRKLFSLEVPEIADLVGRLKFRLSYSQNQWKHAIEVGYLAGMLAAEMGLDPNRWFRHTELAMLALRKREPVRYVANINKYYVAYQLQFEHYVERQKERDILRKKMAPAKGKKK